MYGIIFNASYLIIEHEPIKSFNMLCIKTYSDDLLIKTF